MFAAKLHIFLSLWLEKEVANEMKIMLGKNSPPSLYYP